MRVRIGVATIALFTCVWAVSAQQGPAAAGSPPQARATAKSDPAPHSVLVATNPANTKWTLQPHGVITDDDLAAMRTGVAINYLWSETKMQPSTDPSFCDAGCEIEARAEAGMNATSSAEWHGQVEAARADLAGDGEWRAAYLDGLQKAHQYCVFHSQPNNVVGGPAARSGGDREQYAGDMNRELGGAMDQAAARLQRKIQLAEKSDSVRAAMMEVLAERAFNQCPASSNR